MQRFGQLATVKSLNVDEFLTLVFPRTGLIADVSNMDSSAWSSTNLCNQVIIPCTLPRRPLWMIGNVIGIACGIATT